MEIDFDDGPYVQYTYHVEDNRKNNIRYPVEIDGEFLGEYVLYKGETTARWFDKMELAEMRSRNGQQG